MTRLMVDMSEKQILLLCNRKKKDVERAFSAHVNAMADMRRVPTEEAADIDAEMETEIKQIANIKNQRCPRRVDDITMGIQSLKLASP